MYTVDFTVGTDTQVEIKATKEGKVLLSIDGEAFAFSTDDAKRFAHNFMTIANAAAMLVSQTRGAVLQAREQQPMYVVVGTDGTRPVVWGIGRTESAAREDARIHLDGGDSDDDADTLVAVEVPQTVADRVLEGEVSCATLGIDVACDGEGKVVSAGMPKEVTG